MRPQKTISEVTDDSRRENTILKKEDWAVTRGTRTEDAFEPSDDQPLGDGQNASDG